MAYKGTMKHMGLQPNRPPNVDHTPRPNRSPNMGHTYYPVQRLKPKHTGANHTPSP